MLIGWLLGNEKRRYWEMGNEKICLEKWEMRNRKYKNNFVLLLRNEIEEISFWRNGNGE